nr:hypothetical protein [Tanacetum cinerariifolium]
ASHIAARSRLSSNRSKSIHRSSSLVVTLTSAVRIVGIPISAALHIGARGFRLALFHPSKLDRVFSALLPLSKIQAKFPPQLFESIDAPARQLTEPFSRIPH